MSIQRALLASGMAVAIGFGVASVASAHDSDFAHGSYAVGHGHGYNLNARAVGTDVLRTGHTHGEYVGHGGGLHEDGQGGVWQVHPQTGQVRHCFLYKEEEHDHNCTEYK